jgi:hypothetical protein
MHPLKRSVVYVVWAGINEAIIFHAFVVPEGLHRYNDQLVGAFMELRVLFLTKIIIPELETITAFVVCYLGYHVVQQCFSRVFVGFHVR